MDKRTFTFIEPVSENIVRVSYAAEDKKPEHSVITEKIPNNGCISNCYETDGNQILFKSKSGEIVLRETEHSLTEKPLYKYIVDGEPVIKHKHTANGDVAYIENAQREPTGTVYEGRLVFEITEDEHIYGLGQHEDGIFNYNGKTEYLFQTNMKISIPFVISSKNYGILIDTESALVFDGRNGRVAFSIDAVNRLSYYVITGSDFNEIIRSLRVLSGNTVMLPRWAFGYAQSKERYRSSEELSDTVQSFRQRGIPIDCIVQDWLTWEDGLWGEKRVDKSRYPKLKELVDGLHEKHVKLMVSIWPNMAAGGSNHREFKQKDLFLPNSTTYDAFNEEAREVYWKQCEEEWFASGVDAWWCDSAEPFIDSDWCGARKNPDEIRYQLVLEDFKKSMDWTRSNTYGLFHSKGIYENWRRNSKKRVVNLTRSTYTSGQRYGVVPWSGDTSAKWSTLRNQITEGIKFSLSGMPYWTLDIGGFFTVKDKWENRGCGNAGNSTPLWFWDGDYNDGVDDLGYRELYVRWLQFGVFLPMFRSHGTDTPREPWHFGNKGEIFYDTIVKFINLRYHLLPYIYSTAAAVCFEHDTMLRGLMLDFADDKNVRDISDSFMFGRAFLVCPVTEPMYYEANSVPVENTSKTKDVYLPGSCFWFDYWTNERFAGGQSVTCDAPLSKLPLFVRAGSIVPVSDPLTYADEKNGETSEILIYSGADGDFTLYNDEGDDYSYENDNYSSIKLTYCDKNKSLTFGNACGKYKYQENFKVTLIINASEFKTANLNYQGQETVVYF